jgi:hypothetical protein
MRLKGHQDGDKQAALYSAFVITILIFLAQFYLTTTHVVSLTHKPTIITHSLQKKKIQDIKGVQCCIL